MAAPAAVDAIHSHNFILNRWVTAAYVEQGGITKITPHKTKVKASKATTLRSALATEEKIPGNIDEGQCSFTMIFRKGTYNTLRGTLRVNQNWQVLASDSGSTWTFDGFITELGPDVPEDDTVTVDVVIDITGPVVFVAGS